MMARIERSHRLRLLAATPALGALALVLVFGTPEAPAGWLLMGLVLALTAAATLVPHIGEGHRLRTLGNLIDALREGDYGARGVVSARDDEHARVVMRFNALAVHLQDEQDGRLRLVNPAGEQLLARPATELLGRDADDLGLAPLFAIASGSIRAHAFPGQQGRWQIGHAALRSRSQAGRLLVVQPMERALREEEAQAFRRLLRVLSHEVNNSLAPIASMADTLRRLLPDRGAPLDATTRAELGRGLDVIEQRSGALQRFLGGYARLARLPPPRPAPLALAPLCERVRGLLGDPRLRIQAGDTLQVLADADQLEQVLINLVRNALEAGGGEDVVLRWREQGGQARIEILDAGLGLPPDDNLFVPFFTTKQQGSGIGLVLSRQIVEAQQGRLTLEPRADAQGSVAAVVLPLHDAR